MLKRSMWVQLGKAFISLVFKLKNGKLKSPFSLLLYFLFSFNIAWQKQETSLEVASLIYSGVSLPSAALVLTAMIATGILIGAECPLTVSLPGLFGSPSWWPWATRVNRNAGTAGLGQIPACFGL